MNDTTNSTVSLSSLARRSALLIGVLALGLPSIGCDKAKPDDAKKADAGKKADGKKNDEKKADGKTDEKGAKPGGEEAEPAEPAEKPTELAQVEVGETTLAIRRIWLKWDGSKISYYDGPGDSANPDHPPASATWSDPVAGEIEFDVDADAIVRALGYDTAGGTSIGFKTDVDIAAGADSPVTFSGWDTSTDTWHFTANSPDPVFHIKSGSSGSGAACHRGTLSYDGTQWCFTKSGGSEDCGADACVHPDTSLFNINLKNASSNTLTFQAEQKRPLGHNAYVGFGLGVDRADPEETWDVAIYRGSNTNEVGSVILKLNRT